jgi:hypothetical protein
MSQIDLVEIQGESFVGVRVIKTIGGQPAGYHRAAIAPGQNPDDVIAAIEADLAAMGVDSVATWSPASAMVAATHTPEVVKEFQAVRAAALAAIAPAVAPAPPIAAGPL